MSDEELNEAVERLKFGFGRPSSASDFLDKYGEAIHHRIAALEAERDTAQKKLLAEESAHSETIRHRDFCEEWADKLASGVGDIELIGEHSNLNNPWVNAYNLMRSHAEFESLKARAEAAEKERDAAVRRAEELEGVLDSITDQAVMSGKVQTELIHKASKLLCK